MMAIRDTFFLECEEQLAELEAGLMAMEAGASDTDTVNAVFRAVHSIKGGGGAFALEDLVRFAHVFETTLDGVRAGRLVAEAAAIKVMLRAADVVADLVRAARDGGSVDDGLVNGVLADLNMLNGTGDSDDAGEDDLSDLVFEPVHAMAPLAKPANSWRIGFAPRPELYAHGNEAGLLLRELARLGTLAVTLDESALPELAALDPEGAYLSWTVRLEANCDEAQLRDVFDFVEGDCELSIGPDASFVIDAPGTPATPVDDAPGIDIAALLAAAASPAPVVAAAAPAPAADPHAPAPAKPEAAAATIRVDLLRVDRLIDLVGELVINEAMLNQRVLEAGLTRASGMVEALEGLGQLTREIQDSVMAIRAQPVRSVFQRMTRLVREVGAMTGKQVRLVTEGEGTEVDKTVIERLADPLTHMIRNAIDHGLESTETRIATGKAAEGVVRLSALHRSGRIVIEVADDGAGINRARVRGKAVENGLIAADAPLTDEEVDNLIFMPGFSTASVVSDISGRGVGMDVVKRSVQALGGRISIASRPGQGSVFTLSLPLTLAVLDGMVVSVAGHTLIVPLGTIVETLQPAREQLHGLGQGTRLISLRGGYIPLLDVGVVLGYRRHVQQSDRSVALLVEGEAGQRAVLMVDTIGGQRQIVIKSLEANYRAVPGIAAATVMGDGRVALILDVDAIISATRAEVPRAEPAASDYTLLAAD